MLATSDNYTVKEHRTRQKAIYFIIYLGIQLLMENLKLEEKGHRLLFWKLWINNKETSNIYVFKI